MKRVKMITIGCDGKSRTSSLPYAVAWTAARAIARETHFDVVLQGEYGTAHFTQDGSGKVEWNDKSTTPGKTTGFCTNTTVCI